jgi:hypothetical protein
MSAGAAGSLGFLLRAGQHTSVLVLAVMTAWVLAPFAAVGLADFISGRWTVLTRRVLYIVMLVLTFGTMVVYAYDALRPRKAQAGFLFVATPIASWLLIALAVPAAALVSRRQSRGGVET